MEKRKENIEGKEVEINYLGEEIHSLFIELYKNTMNTGFNLSNDFKYATYKFFDDNKRDFEIHNKYFQNFTSISIELCKQKRIKDAETIWEKVLKVVNDWEANKSDERIHKGTIYYFWGVTCLLNEDDEKGFLLMHQAVEEDKKSFNSNFQNQPPFSFVTLNYDNINQFFYKTVDLMKNFIQDSLNKYNDENNGNLNLDNFKSKFLENNDLIDIVFYFVFSTFRLKRMLDKIDPFLKENNFCSLLQLDIIFSFCSVLENILKYKNTEQGAMFAKHLTFISNNDSLCFENRQKTQEIGKSFTSDFSITVENLIKGNYLFIDNYKPKPIEVDLALAYGFRNFRAHKIENQPIIYSNFTILTERIIHGIFYSIEKLY